MSMVVAESAFSTTVNINFLTLFKIPFVIDSIFTLKYPNNHHKIWKVPTIVVVFYLKLIKILILVGIIGDKWIVKFYRSSFSK